MSADNFMAVLKEAARYVGYHCSASADNETPQWRKCYPCIGTKTFEVDTLEEAVRECEHFGYLEYGYRFIDQNPIEEPKEGFCEVCAYNPNLPLEGSKKAKRLGCNCERVGKYSVKLGKDCPVHFNKKWQEKVGIGERINDLGRHPKTG